MPFFEHTTVFHVTHYKAGSRWIHRILKRCVRERLLAVQADRKELLEEPIEPGRVYSACYVTKDEFDGLETPPDSKRFVVLRDPRDTLVSGYFSLKGSHPTYKNEEVAAMRGRLQDMDLEQGLLHTLEDWLPANIEIQRSWIESGEPIVQFEELLKDDHGILRDVLLTRCELGVPERRLRKAIDRERFDRLSGGRQPGEEDTTAHYRKGIAGDWRNYFSEPLKDAFKESYGELLIKAGYERDSSW
jgi:lipopolysaccharide transport system ATP-binding protein